MHAFPTPRTQTHPSCAPKLSLKPCRPNPHLQGGIPSSLSLLPDVTTLDLSRNDFAGTIPTELSALSPATRLILDGNPRLCGGIPLPVAEGPSLRAEGTALNAPCFSQQVVVMLRGGESVPLAANAKVC